MVQEPLMIIGTLAALFIFSTRLTLFVLILFPVAAFIITYVGKKLKKPSKMAKEELGRIVTLMEEHLSGLLIIKSFQAEDRMYESFTSSNSKYKKSMDHMLFLRELSSPLSEILGFAVISAVIWYGGYLILDENSLQPAIFITYIVMFYQIITPAKTLSHAIYDINRAEASSKRVIDLLETKNSIPEPKDPKPIKEVKNSIHFNHVTFSYEKDTVIKDVELYIPVGKTYALVGESGSGKSTLVSLLNRFYDVDEGGILIDGTDIRSFKKTDLRTLFGYISQESILFNDSIRNNLLVAKPTATEEEMNEALRMANAEEFVEKFEKGIDTRVGERGGNLSGGQRQRIAIARAILKDPPVLLLDEATSALDSASEKLVQEAFDRLLEGRTAIVIAHRLSTIQNADQIIVMKNGHIIERGNHIELIDLGGEYCKFVELQNV
jgi:subfamily B ATP-binding cassette protein MsbA